MEIKKIRQRSASTALILSILQIVGGGIVSFAFTMLFIIFRVVEQYAQRSPSISRIFLLLLLAGAALLVFGIRNCLCGNRCRKFMQALARRPGATTVSQLADMLSMSESQVVTVAEQSLAARFWSGYSLTQTTLVLVDDAKVSHVILAGPDMEFGEAQRRSRAAWFLFAAVWVVAALTAGFDSLLPIVVTAVLSLAVLIAAAALLPKRIAISYKKYREAPEKPVVIDTGSEEADEMLKTGLAQLEELKALDKSINDEKLDKPVREIMEITRQIFEYVRQNPDKVRQTRQFVNYYLPTTIKLLKSYEELDRQAVKGDNIKESMKKIEGIMEGVLFTFHQQLDDLYRDRNIDIAADIAVMENMINKEDLITPSDSGN